MLSLNNIEVIYNDVILVLKGMSMKVPEGKIVGLLGSNGAGKSTTLKAISGLLKPEDGEVTDGSIVFKDKEIHHQDAEDTVRAGIFQVMEGRRVFEHLTTEENLIAGGYTRPDSGQVRPFLFISTQRRKEMSRKTMYTLFAAFILAAMMLTACGGGGAAVDETIKVGAIHDLTGPTSDVGTPYAEGIKGYVAWRNANGGIEGMQIELISADYAYKVDQAELLYTQYTQEGAVVFQGWGTGDTEALRGKVAADQIPFMSASYSAGLLDMEEAPYNFLVGTSYSDQAIIALRWAIDDWAAAGNDGAPSVAITHHDSPFGQSPVEDAAAYAEANGVEFMSLPMPGGVTDYVAELAQMQQFGANYIIIHTVSSPAAIMIKDAASQGLDTQFVCLNWCADEGMVELAGDAAEGVVGAIPFTPPSSPVSGHEDAAAWLKENGGDLDEIGLHYTQGWWTMATMAEGIEIVVKNGDELTGANIKAALETLSNFDTGGVTSPLTFTSSSHRGNNALRLYQVEGGVWNSISDFISAE